MAGNRPLFEGVLRGGQEAKRQEMQEMQEIQETRRRLAPDRSRSSSGFRHGHYRRLI